MAKTATVAFRQWSVDGPFMYFDANRRVEGDNLVIDALPFYPAIVSRDRYDLTESHFGTRIVSVPNVVNGSTEMHVSVTLDANNALTIAWGNNAIITIYKVNGVSTNTYDTFSPVNHKYVRVRESGGMVYWEASATGTTWTNLRAPLASPFAVNDISLAVLAGNWNSAVSPGTAVFGAVNLYDILVNNTVIDFGIGNPFWPMTSAVKVENTTESGRAPKYELGYSAWGGSNRNFTAANLNSVNANGMVPYLTWEAWDGTQSAAYSYANILAGNFDTVIDDAAAACKAFGKTMYLRPFHEMNGTWYPWAIGVNGNTIAQHKSAWDYLRTRFSNAGVTNVKWVWSPNASYSGSTSITSLYPGDSKVDVVAVDGYNFGAPVNNDGTSWITPSQLFDPTFAELRSIGVTKPVWIGETASSEGGGSKSDWITQFFSWMRGQAEITAFVWFNHDKERDWRISSTTTSAASFRTGMSTITASTVDVVSAIITNVKVFLGGSWVATNLFKKVL